MNEEALSALLRAHYGIEGAALQFLREGGSRTYLVEGDGKYFLKVIGAAFAETSRQSVSIMRYLENHGFPVPKTILTRTGDALLTAQVDGEERLIVLQEYIDGDEPDLEARAYDVGELAGRLHVLLEGYPEQLVSRGREFFVGRYPDLLRRKGYPRVSAYEELGEALWRRVEGLPEGNCHGDLHRGNLLESPDGRICLLDFDTVCRAPLMFDVMVMCDMTDYFRLEQKDIDSTFAVYDKFLAGYTRHHSLSGAERRSFPDWVAIRHFQLQATILELYGLDCIDERFIDAQLDWLERWLEAAGRRAYGI